MKAQEEIVQLSFLLICCFKVLQDVKKEYGTTIELPVVPFIVVVGFLLVLIIEQTVLHFQVCFTQ